MKKKAAFKFNGGKLALLCTSCKVIIKTGWEFTVEELEACQGKKDLPPQFCITCKDKNEK